MHSSGHSRFRRRATTLTVSVALLIAGGPTAAGAAVELSAAGANCYNDGTVSTTLWWDKIGVEGEWHGVSIHFWDLVQRRYTFETPWRSSWSGSGWVPGSPRYDYRKIDRGRYLIYVRYGWNRGYGWNLTGRWVGSYQTGGGYFGVPESFCRAEPILQTVTGCANYGTGIPSLACTSRTTASSRRHGSGKRLRRPERSRIMPPPPTARRPAELASP
jgi:hypothetical protein